MNAINFREKIVTFQSYLIRPNTYPFLCRLIKMKILGGSLSLEKSHEKATAWCKKRAVNTAEGLFEITGIRMDPTLVIRNQFHDIFYQADKRVKNCPQVMGGEGNLDLLFYLAQHFQSKAVIETGVAYGWSSLALLLSITNRPSAQLISTNLHYSRYGDDGYVGCAVPENFKDKWTILREADRTAIPNALALMPTIDLCHYDSDKTYTGRLWAYPFLWNALKVGGCFISDDVGDNLAFKHFCHMVRQKPIIISMPASAGTKYIGILLKQDNRSPRQIMF